MTYIFDKKVSLLDYDSYTHREGTGWEYALNMPTHEITEEDFAKIDKFLVLSGFKKVAEAYYLSGPNEEHKETNFFKKNPMRGAWVNELHEVVCVIDPAVNPDGIEIRSMFKSKDFADAIMDNIIKLRNRKPSEGTGAGKIFMMVMQYNQLSTKAFSVTQPESSINDTYSQNILEKHEDIIKKLEGKRPGIHLFWGEPGTGKTTYIRHLTSLVKKKFIFMPPNFGEILADPGFIPFLLNQAQDSVLVMEDAETVIKERDLEGNHAAIANVLNMTDGLMGDVIRPQIVFTFNCDLKKIDKAILRKGRCLTNLEFTALEAEKATNLSKIIGHNKEFIGPATLAEITQG